MKEILLIPFVIMIILGVYNIITIEIFLYKHKSKYSIKE